MKTMFEHMTTMIITVVLLFAFSSLVVAQFQIIGARKVHTSAINQMQSSYYAVNAEELNASLHEELPNWNFSVQEIQSIHSRKDYIITLDYQVIVPVFNVIKTGQIQGYAR